jgi:hypothetical protein
MNKIALVAAAALTMGTFGLAAIAQDSESNFNKADSNGDGLVSYEESLIVSTGVTQALFDQADANADGNLDEGEFQSLETLAQALGNTTTSETSSSAVTDASSSVSNNEPGPSSSSVGG